MLYIYYLLNKSRTYFATIISIQFNKRCFLPNQRTQISKLILSNFQNLLVSYQDYKNSGQVPNDLCTRLIYEKFTVVQNPHTFPRGTRLGSNGCLVWPFTGIFPQQPHQGPSGWGDPTFQKRFSVPFEESPRLNAPEFCIPTPIRGGGRCTLCPGISGITLQCIQIQHRSLWGGLL